MTPNHVPKHIVQVDECACTADPNFFATHGRPRWEFLDRQETCGWGLCLFRCAAHGRRCPSYRVIAARGDDEIVMWGVSRRSFRKRKRQDS